MKKTNKIAGFLSCSIFAVSLFMSCSLPSYPEKNVTPGGNNSKEFADYSSYSVSGANVSNSFMKGIDASEVKALEEAGLKFYDEDNSQKDVFKILSEHGVNWIRLRIWNDYTKSLDAGWGPYGYNNLNRTINMAQRAKKYGMKVLLDFHYSDNWADPSKQACPDMWKDITDKDELAAAVGEYTKEILSAMKVAGCAPDMVQLGNEMQGGLFQTGSKVTNAKNYTADYLKAGAVAVKEVLPDCQIMLHMSNGGKSSYKDTMLSYANTIGSDANGKKYVSVIGVSYYTWYASHGKDTELKSNLQAIKTAGYLPVIVENSFAYSNDAYTDSTNNTYYQSSTPTGESKCCGEQTAINLTGYNYGTGIVNGQIDSSIENQAGIIKYLMELASSVDSNSGYFYWGACYLGIDGIMPSSWENQTLFDVNGKVLPSLNVYNAK